MASGPFNSSFSSFLLVGVPGLESFSTCLGILFCSAYVVALLGNGAVLLVTGLDRSLSAPGHRLLALLAALDLLMVTAVVPKLLAVLWLHSAHIGTVPCFVQMFFVHSTTAEESGVLLAMAVDRYVAICHPLRYRSILTVTTVTHMGLAIVLRALLVMLPFMVLVTSLPYCGPRLVPHSYCEHQAVAQLACASPGPAGLYSVTGSSLVVATDVAVIAVSYGMILRAVPGRESRRKALDTCGCHVCVVLLFYLPGLVSIYAQHFSTALPVPARVLLADLYLALPPVLNPFVYSARSRQIRHALLRGLRGLRGLQGLRGLRGLHRLRGLLPRELQA